MQRDWLKLGADKDWGSQNKTLKESWLRQAANAPRREIYCQLPILKLAAYTTDWSKR
jgi:hypothetical protein